MKATHRVLFLVVAVGCADPGLTDPDQIIPPDPVIPRGPPVALRWTSGSTGAFVDDTIRLYALYTDSGGRLVDQPRPVLTWSSSDSTVVRIASDTLAIVLNTGTVALSALAQNEPRLALVVPITTVPRFTGRLIWVSQPTRESQFRDVWVQDFPVGAPRRLHHFGHATESKAQPMLTADGRQAVVVSSPPNGFGPLRLYLVDLTADTSHMLFPTLPGSYAYWPIWMPGDSVLAFLRGGPCGAEVFTARLDGGDLRQRTSARQCSPPFFDVTPDGNLVLLLPRHFVQGQGNNADIYEITMAGDTVRRLTDTTTYEGWPAVSPGGSQIAYMRGEATWLMNRDGSGTRPLLPPPMSEWTGHSPAWSRDGKYIVLQLYADIYIDKNSNGEDYYYGNSQIYAVRVADGLAIRLTHTLTGEVQPDFR